MPDEVTTTVHSASRDTLTAAAPPDAAHVIAALAALPPPPLEPEPELLGLYTAVRGDKAAEPSASGDGVVSSFKANPLALTPREAIILGVELIVPARGHVLVAAQFDVRTTYMPDGGYGGGPPPGPPIYARLTGAGQASLGTVKQSMRLFDTIPLTHLFTVEDAGTFSFYLLAVSISDKSDPVEVNNRTLTAIYVAY